MTQDERIERLENRVDRLESNIDEKLDRIYEKVNTLTVDAVRNACPSPGACIGLGNDLAHAIKAHDATMRRVERLELKILEVEKSTAVEFQKWEKQKAWLLGVWSAVAFFASVVGALVTALINYYTSK